MLLSMTGYGRATLSEGAKTYTVELRGLNSKQTDLRLRSNQSLQQHELELRTLVLEAVKRGKLEMNLEIAHAGSANRLKVDLPLLAELSTNIYFNLKTSLPDSTMDGLVPALLRTPGIIEAGSGELEEQDWPHIQTVTRDCLETFQDYRHQEGLVLAEDLRTSVRAITELLSRVSDYDSQRIAAVRDRMERHLSDYVGRANVDQNRYEQEVLFYLEKMDINEEQVRLQQNCDYFLEVLDNEEDVKGRKLNFISQEMGREINTLGAKAYSADLQKLVVNMKEQLEMIKEQLANVA